MTYRPTLKMIDDSLVSQIYGQALEILDKLGVFFENEEALSLLKKNGLKPNNKGRVCFSPELVHDALKSAPSSIQLYDREGKPAVDLGSDRICFNPGSAAINILDYDTNEMRQPTTSDYVSYAKLVNHLQHLGAQSTAMVCADVPREIADCYRLYLALAHCSKPVVTGTFRKESFEVMKNLLIAVRGSEEELRKKPLAIFDACPSSPLRWSDLTSQSVIDAARFGIPSEIISMPMMGANSPATIFGTVVIQTAESLSGIAFSQLVSRGAPVIWGGSPSRFDMRHGTTPMGAIETMMIDCSYSQVAKSLNMPTHAYMGLTDVKVLDVQGGFETGIGAILAALSGINMISGPGMIDFESCFSLEKLVLDNDVCGMAYRLIDGVTNHKEVVTKDIIAEYENKKQLLSHPTTVEFYKKEFYFPSTAVDRTTRQQWAMTKSNANERAHDIVRELVMKPSPYPISESRERELIEIMTEEAKKVGIRSLPEI